VDAPGVVALKPLLPAGEAGTSVGVRGEARQRRGTLSAPAALGPFVVAHADVALVQGRMSKAPPVNIGNRFLRAMDVRLLVDVPARRLGFFGDCG